MKKVLTFVSVLACLAAVEAQNVTVATAIGQSPETFVRNHLAGPGVHVFNVKYNNTPSPIYSPNIGTFTAPVDYDSLGMSQGIVLCTGTIDIVPGPNDNPSAASPLDGRYVDPLMAPFYGSGATSSCATLDFDFVCLTDSFAFNYVFASENYPELNCSIWNSFFVAFVTGQHPYTGALTTYNAAIIPGTVDALNPDGIVVSLNTINDGTHYVSPYMSEYGENCRFDFTDYYRENPAESTGIQFDGYTVLMTATGRVVPCETYHMHLSLLGIGAGESATFLAEKSLRALNMNLSAVGAQEEADTLRGECRLQVPLLMGETDGFSYGGTAVEGVDFVVTDNGEGFTISGLAGADLSTPKTVEVYLASSPCGAYPELLLYDTLRYVLTEGGGVELRDTIITCSHACFEVSAPLLAGEEPVSYRWKPATGLENPYSRTTAAAIFESADYLLIATGGSGCHSDTATVSVVITGEDALGIGNVANSDLRIYPNPAADVIHVDAEGLQRVELFTLDGRKVYEAAGGNGSTIIPTDGLQNDVYGLRVSTATGMAGAKIVINK